MKENFEQALVLVLRHEGGWVNHPKDPGGETNMGVTKRTWEEWVGHEVDSGSLKNLTVEAVAPLYKQKYWDKIRGDEMPDGVDYALFDFAVNSGPSRAIKTLQQIVGATPDGILGPKTIAAVRAMNPRDLTDEICDKRLEFLQGLPTWTTFGRGWSRRVSEVERTAFDMVTAQGSTA